MSDSARPSYWRSAPPLTEPAPDPPLWRDPPRLMLVVAAIGVTVGSIMPWAEGTGLAARQESFRATQGTGEGVFLIAGALLLAFLARNRFLWETASRAVQLLPLAVGAVSVVMWIGAEHYAGQRIAEWTSMGGSGQLTTARYVVAGSIGLIFLAFLYLERKRSPAVRARTRPLWVEWGLSRWSLVMVGSTLVCGAAGAIIGVVIGILVADAFVLVAVILGVFGLFIGIGAGVLVARQIERLARDRGRPG